MRPKTMQPGERHQIESRDGGQFFARRLERNDLALLQEFNQALGSKSRRRFLPHAYDDANLERLLKRADAGADLLLGLFAAGDNHGQPCPMIGYFFLWYFNERVPLLGIGLLDQWQGRGLGAPMIRLLLAEATRAGCEGVELTTMPENEPAFKLYQRCGFDYYADVENRDGNGRIIIERAMFYRIKAGAAPFDRPHSPP